MRKKISSDARLAQDVNGEHYMAFLLRCWVEEELGADQAPIWRFTLVKLDGHQRKRGFANLPALFSYLSDEITAKTQEEGHP